MILVKLNPFMGIRNFTLYYVVCWINSSPAKDKIFQILIKRRLLADILYGDTCYSVFNNEMKFGNLAAFLTGVALRNL